VKLPLTGHRDAEALEDFERAQLLGELRSPWKDKIVELYRAAHSGSDTGLPAEMDAQYARLFPPVFTPAKKALSTGGHTVLVELFTGSACPPCVGGDLAVEGLLEAYPRTEVVALAFDQHIPEPDPLANPDSVARAAVYGVNGTPSYVLDGKLLPFYGAGRSSSEELYGKLSKAVDAQAVKASGVQLALTAENGTGGLVLARAQVSIGEAKSLMEAPAIPPPSAPVPVPAPTAAKAAKSAAAAPAVAPQPAGPPQLVVSFALVEDEVRYSGENGMRFHRMVVRAVSPEQAVETGKTAELKTSFDPEAISGKLKTYLADYQTHNERFGKIEFLSMDTAIAPEHLAVVAWVQDKITHRVLGTAFVPLGGKS